MNMGSYDCCAASGRESKQILSLSSLLKIVAEESRLKLLCILKDREHCVCKMVEHLDLSQSLISHHLKDLKEAGIVGSTKKGQYVYYSLTQRGRRIADLLFQIR